MNINASELSILEESLEGIEKSFSKRYPDGSCIRCRSRVRLCVHHITYVPVSIILLCQGCHSQVSLANAAASIVLKRKLTSDDRKYIWDWFVKYKGIITRASSLGTTISGPFSPTT